MNIAPEIGQMPVLVKIPQHPAVVVMDTNVWVYLCNNNSQDGKVDHQLHIKTRKQLEDLISKGAIVLLKNGIIVDEYYRNQSSKSDYLTKIDRRILANNNRKKNLLRNDKSADVSDVQSLIDEDIAQRTENKEHIRLVDDLFEKTQLMPALTTEGKARAFDQALAKMAPFNGKKSNSMADFGILMNLVETRKAQNLVGDCYFISANKGDFASKEEPDQIHPDLKAMLDEGKIKFASNLGKALEEIAKTRLFSNDEIEMFYDWDVNTANCLYCWDKGGMIDFNVFILVYEPNYPTFNDDSPILPLEGVEKVVHPVVAHETTMGQCSCCGSWFIRCPFCGAIMDIDENLKCDGCDAEFDLAETRDKKGEIISRLFSVKKPEKNRNGI